MMTTGHSSCCSSGSVEGGFCTGTGLYKQCERKCSEYWSLWFWTIKGKQQLGLKAYYAICRERKNRNEDHYFYGPKSAAVVQDSQKQFRLSRITALSHSGSYSIKCKKWSLYKLQRSIQVSLQWHQFFVHYIHLLFLLFVKWFWEVEYYDRIKRLLRRRYSSGYGAEMRRLLSRSFGRCTHDWFPMLAVSTKKWWTRHCSRTCIITPFPAKE